MISKTDDKHLMIQFQEQGDYDAIETLFRRHRDGFLGFLRRLSGSDDIAEDISQHTWMRLIEIAKRSGYHSDSKASFRTYLFTLGRNRYIDEYHRKHEVSKRQSFPNNVEYLDTQVDSGDDPAKEIAALQMRDAVREALMELPLEQREAVAFWSVGVGPETVAGITGASRHTIISRRKYAIKKLKARFDDDEWGGADT